jgi:hypothetical protein
MSVPNQTLTPHMQMVNTLQECLNKASRLGISLLVPIDTLTDCDAIKAHMMEYKEEGLKVTENLFQHLARDTEYDRISCIFSIACQLGFIAPDTTSPIAAYKKSNRGNMENQVMIFLGKVANGEYPMETISYKECVNLPGGKFITLQNQAIMIHIPTGTKIIIDCKPTHTINGKSPIRTFYQMENLQRVESDFKKGRMPKGDLSLYDFLHAKADGHIISRLVSNNSENGFKDQYSAIVDQPELKKTATVLKPQSSTPTKQGEKKLRTGIDFTTNTQNRTQTNSEIVEVAKTKDVFEQKFSQSAASAAKTILDEASIKSQSTVFQTAAALIAMYQKELVIKTDSNPVGYPFQYIDCLFDYEPTNTDLALALRQTLFVLSEVVALTNKDNVQLLNTIEVRTVKSLTKSNSSYVISNIEIGGKKVTLKSFLKNGDLVHRGWVGNKEVLHGAEAYVGNDINFIANLVEIAGI